MPFPYQKIFMLTAVPRDRKDDDAEKTVEECKIEIIEKTLEKFPGVKVTVMYMPTAKDRSYDFFVAVDEKVKMPWT